MKILDVVLDVNENRVSPEQLTLFNIVVTQIQATFMTLEVAHHNSMHGNCNNFNQAILSMQETITACAKAIFAKEPVVLEFSILDAHEE